LEIDSMIHHSFRLFFAADKGGEAGAAQTPATTRGVTLAERESRSANERPISQENESSIPGLSDITANLNLMGMNLKSSGEPTGEQETQQADPVTEITQEEQEEDPSNADEQNATGQEETQEQQEKQTEEEQPGETGAEEQQQEQAEEGPIDEIVEADGKRFKLPPEVQASLNARFAELTAKRKVAETQLAELTPQLETLKAERDQFKAVAEGKIAAPVRIAPTVEQPLADVTSMEELAARVQHAEQKKLWCMEHAKGAEIRKNATSDETVFLSEDEVREHAAEAERVLMAAPKRAKFLQEQAAETAPIREAYPDLYKPGTELNTTMQNVKANLPWLTALPNGDAIIAHAIVGEALFRGQMDHPLLKNIMAKRQAPANPLKPVVKPLHKGPSGTVAPRVPAKIVEQQKAGSKQMSNLGDARSTLAMAMSLVG
jgi:hypothetical protein